MVVEQNKSIYESESYIYAHVCMISKQKTCIDFQFIYSNGAPFEAAGLKSRQRQHMNEAPHALSCVIARTHKTLHVTRMLYDTSCFCATLEAGFERCITTQKRHIDMQTRCIHTQTRCIQTQTRPINTHNIDILTHTQHRATRNRASSDILMRYVTHCHVSCHTVT